MRVGVTQNWAESQFYHGLARSPFLHLQSELVTEPPLCNC